MAGAGPGQGLVDTRVLGKPGTFSGKDEDWPEWSFVMKAYIVCTGTFTGKALKTIEESAAPWKMPTQQADVEKVTTLY